MEQEMTRAKLLLEALPYIREFYGRTVVIKYGGHAMQDEQLKKSFALNVVLLKYIGVNPVIVHGGGPQIGQMLNQLGISSKFEQGLRVTDQATMDVVEMVLVGRVNKEIVNLINLNGGRSVGLSGKDGGLIQAKKMEMVISKTDAPPEIIDLGRVGEVVSIQTKLIRSLEKEGFIPIIAPVGVDTQGRTYNINADAVAGSVAKALEAKKLILLTDVSGVMAGEQLVSSLSRSQVLEMIENSTAQGGMIPKLKCCLEALEAGVEKAHIIDGRLENSLILELFTQAGIGTEILG
ncbi:MAG: acetylglutamate kinase [Desulfohalobiaceae bacterium]